MPFCLVAFLPFSVCLSAFLPCCLSAFSVCLSAFVHPCISRIPAFPHYRITALLSSSQRQHRARRMTNHLVGRRTKQHEIQRVASVHAEDDQIGVLCAGGGNDLLVRLAVDDGDCRFGRLRHFV